MVSAYFRQRVEDPASGRLEIMGERYLLVRAASLSVEFVRVVEELFGPGREGEAQHFARNILFDLAHALGRADARTFHERMGLADPVERLSAGPVHFAHTGWALVDVSSGSKPTVDEDYLLIYDHLNSFEAEAWLEAGRKSDLPVCIMNAGYSSGWCQESFGPPLVAAEIECRARGDARCRFIMAPPSRIEARIRTYLEDVRLPDTPGGRYEIPDLFSRKRLEDELRRAHDELEVRVRERTEELRRANERLQMEIAERARLEGELIQAEKLRALGQLAGGVAHDFNNLLTVIQASAELAESEPHLPARARAALGDIRWASRSAAELTDQLLAFSRRQPATPRVVDLGAALSEMRKVLERLIGSDVALRVQVPPAPACVLIDPAQLQQIVMNLAANARDAMPRGGHLEITVRVTHDGRRDAQAGDPGTDDAGWVELEVRDDGQGMDEATRTRLFEPFFTTKSLGRGSGLGLATVYGIVQQSGGDVVVESAPGTGTTFRIRWPRVLADPDPTAPDAPERTTPIPAGATVLVVEDQEQIRTLLEKTLRRAGLHVLSTGDPRAAESLLQEAEGAVDLLITDVVMPGLDGPALAERLRAVDPALPVIFISGYPDEVAGERRPLGPHAAFLQKPFRLEELLEAVARTLGD